MAVDLLERGRDRLRHSDPDNALILAAEAEKAAQTAGDQVTRALALSLMARCLRQRDDYPEALAAAVEAVRVGLGLGGAEAYARAELSRVLLAAGDTGEALQEALTAQDLADAAGDLGASIEALTAVAYAYLYLQQFDLSVQLCERAGEIARLVGDEVAEGVLIDTAACALMGTAETARDDGDETAAVRAAQDAAERSRAAMVIARRVGHRRNEASALANLAEEMTFVGEPEQALTLMSGWEARPGVDATYTITHHLDTRGSICLAMGMYAEAIAFFEQSLDLAESESAQMVTNERLAEAYELAGDYKAALAAHKRYHRLYCLVASETAQRNARVAAIRMETDQAKATAERERVRADGLHRMSMEDPLTGLANRRTLDDVLASAGSGYAVALIDVDFFKHVNDDYSHQVGDDVLRTLADLLREGCRENDLAARYGGEEFTLLFRGLSATGSAAAADRIRRTVEDYPWEKVADGLAITVSIGVALDIEAPSPAELLSLADRRLYQAKRGGRNRVVWGG